MTRSFNVKVSAGVLKSLKEILIVRFEINGTIEVGVAIGW